MSEPDKAALRAEALARRREQAPKHPDAARVAAKHALAALKLDAHSVVAGYAALRDEMEALPLLAGLAGRRVTTALPCVAAAGAPLVFRVWRPMDALVKARHGTREPAPSAPEARPTVLIVPLLAYDSRGYRLGYGGGYYDRTIAALAREGPAPQVIGLAFAFQKLALLPRSAHDEPLDAVATENGVEWFPRTLEHL